MDYSLSLSGQRPNDAVSDELAGVGLIRGEYLFQGMRMYITLPEAQADLTAYLAHIAALFAPRPVWYRLADMELSEIAVLPGADGHNLSDRIELLGKRAVRRSKLLPEAFRCELRAFATAAALHANLALLVPFVTAAEELAWVMEQARDCGISAPIGIMAEIPATILCLDDFLDLGVARVSVGPHDLSRLTLGSYEIPNLYPRFHPSVLQLISVAREKTARRRLPLAICIDEPAPDEVAAVMRLGLDELTIGYDWLSGCNPELFGHLPDTHRYAETKAWMSQALGRQ